MLQKIHGARGEFVNRDDIITGECVLCLETLSLSWFKWSQHLLEHTHEKLLYCTKCEIGIDNLSDHDECPIESKINIYGRFEIGSRLEGFVCKRCNYLQINDYPLLEHLSEEHPDAIFETDVARVVLVPDMRPQEHIIPTGFAYITPAERYRCGVGNCIFHAKNSTEYIEHFQKTHSTIKTYFCRHCKKIINRMARPTVPLREVMQHLELHSSHIYQCFYCTVNSTSKDAIQTHLTADHADLAVKFWHNRRKVNNEIEQCELIEILLDCCICDERVDGKTLAIEHFRSKHSGCEFKFNAVKLIKVTANNLYVTCSIDDSACYREMFGCGKCDENFTDKEKWLGHFYTMHPDGLLTARHHLKWMKTTKDTATPDQIAYQRLMLFSCVFCTNSQTPYNATIDGCLEHWKHKHIGSDYKPFHFHMIELVACNYCNTIATFQDLKMHITEEHGGKPFVAVKAFEFRKICALCDYATDGAAAEAEAETEDSDLIKHFQDKHSLAVKSNVANPMPFRDLDLRRIRRISVHKMVKCDDTEAMRLIGDCCHTQIDEKQFFNHLANHKHTIACSKCLFETTDAFEFVCHKAECHERRITTIPEKYRNFLERWYWRSNLIFDNGLVLNKFNTIGTYLDNTKEFGRFINSLIDKKMHKYKAERSNTVGNEDAAEDVIKLDD